MSTCSLHVEVTLPRVDELPAAPSFAGNAIDAERRGLNAPHHPETVGTAEARLVYPPAAVRREL